MFKSQFTRKMSQTPTSIKIDYINYKYYIYIYNTHNYILTFTYIIEEKFSYWKNAKQGNMIHMYKSISKK